MWRPFLSRHSYRRVAPNTFQAWHTEPFEFFALCFRKALQDYVVRLCKHAILGNPIKSSHKETGPVTEEATLYPHAMKSGVLGNAVLKKPLSFLTYGKSHHLAETKP